MKHWMVERKSKSRIMEGVTYWNTAKKFRGLLKTIKYRIWKYHIYIQNFEWLMWPYRNDDLYGHCGYRWSLKWIFLVKEIEWDKKNRNCIKSFRNLNFILYAIMFLIFFLNIYTAKPAKTGSQKTRKKTLSDSFSS